MLRSLPAAVLFSWFVTTLTPALAQLPVVDSWQYTLKKPRQDWQSPDFDASRWREGTGGFGSYGTPGARIGTEWTTNTIWLRKTITLDKIPAKCALWIHHDEDAVVFLNGKKVASLDGYINDYRSFPISSDARQALKVGENVLAVRCNQTDGGQFIDVHLVDADHLPKLPPARRKTTPIQTDLITTWGEQLTPENAWTEYPRPQMKRSDWTNLNGNWDYKIADFEQSSAPETWDGDVLVPFAIESKLSGVEYLLGKQESLWYHRTFEATREDDKRALLHFEAVDYQCDVHLNGKRIGSHQGGNTPFSCDATDALIDGKNDLVVRVVDATEGFQLNGKQRINPHGIFYTQISGIWQTVWMEKVPTTYIEDLVIRTDASEATVSVEVKVAGGTSDDKLTYEVVAKDGRQTVANESSDASSITVKVADPKLWSPKSPFLYDLDVVIRDQSGKVVDQVASYAGIRSVSKTKDSDGHLRFTLNGETIFHWGPLDQGWWPDGLLTPPSDEAMLFDIQYLKSAGFNMIRKHIKVEPRRYYYHCDRLGMLVWQDQVSGGKNPPWTRLKPNPEDANWPAEDHDQFMKEFEWMIDTLENHPSIVVWTPFNEAWGQHQTVEVGKWTMQRDPSRQLNIASGGNFWPIGDIVDHHSYPHPEFPFDPSRFADFIKVVGEFGGHGYPVKGHLWDADRRNWGYGGLPESKAEYKQRYIKSLEILNELRGKGIAAGVYTQTTDVEGEINGLMTYDRKVVKIPAEELAKLHTQLFEN